MATVDLPLNPRWGYDPWPGPGKPPGRILKTTRGAKVFTGADTIGGDLGLLPDGLDLYGSYVDNFGGFTQLEALFPKAFLVSFTVFGEPALCADVEPGAMQNADLPRWLDDIAWKDIDGFSWVYTNAANMGDAIAAAGDRKYKRFSAHFGHGPHICGPTTCGFPQADWTQWDDHGAFGQNIDRSIGTYLPAKKPAFDFHYDRYDDRRRVIYGGHTERTQVKKYDRYRAQQTLTKHPHRPALAILRAEFHAGVARLNTLGHPDQFHRKFRKTELAKRAKGGRVG